MMGTYNAPYKGEVLTPEHLFQSIPHAVSPDEVIDAAAELANRATGIVRLLTTNGGCLNDRDTHSGMVALEAVIDQLAVVLHHKTHVDVMSTAQILKPSGKTLELIALNDTARNKVQAIMSYIEADEDSSDIALIVSDLKQLDSLIDSQKQPADTFTTYSAPSDRPEDYLTTGFPVFDSVPHDLISTMLSRATSAIDALIAALESSTGPFMWQSKQDLLWNVCSQLDMVDAALRRVNTESVT